MRRPIIDEFTFLPISRQRKYLLRKQRDGRRRQCGFPVEKGLNPKRIEKLTRLSESEHRKAIALLEEFKRTGRGGEAFAEQNARALNILAQLREATTG
jgi:hypothetical protein